ncbi:MAG: hypothetical protein QF613_07235 [Candidatus Marinimicrobia bacterium]|nr:hypothetical protein [Candidatus Neomarinimicrobiota bacterium]
MTKNQPSRRRPDTSLSGQIGIVSTTVTLLLFLTSAVPQVVRTPWQALPLPEDLRNKNFAPHQLAVNQFGDLYLVDDENYWLARIPGDGSTPRLAGGWGDEDDKFAHATDIKAAPGLDVILSDHASHRLLRFDRKLNFIDDLRLNSSRRHLTLEYPYKIGKNRWEEVIIASSAASELHSLSARAEIITVIGDAAYGEDRLVDVTDIAVNTLGEIAVVDRGTDLLSIFSREGSQLYRVAIDEQHNPSVSSWNGNWLLTEQSGKGWIVTAESRALYPVLQQAKKERQITVADVDIRGDTIYVIDELSGEILTARLRYLE